MNAVGAMVDDGALVTMEPTMIYTTLVIKKS
jgi:hypothetical protein